MPDNSGLPDNYAVCPTIMQSARQLQSTSNAGNNDDGGKQDDELPSDGGSANTIAIILLSISFISAIIIFIGCYALYRTDPVFVMAISLSVFVTCVISAIILFKKSNTKCKCKDQPHKRNTQHRFYTIRTTIERGKNGIRKFISGFINTHIQKSIEGINEDKKCNEGNKDKDSANSLRHTAPLRGK